MMAVIIDVDTGDCLLWDDSGIYASVFTRGLLCKTNSASFTYNRLAITSSGTITLCAAANVESSTTCLLGGGSVTEWISDLCLVLPVATYQHLAQTDDLPAKLAAHDWVLWRVTTLFRRIFSPLSAFIHLGCFCEATTMASDLSV